jgi:hypothetical protein
VKKFEIYAGGILIGSTSFEHGDPPMGVAYGNMALAPNCRFNHAMAKSTLSVRLDGKPIPSNGGLFVEDLLEELGEIQVTILGIDHELYEELFPEHVAAYQEQFGS